MLINILPLLGAGFLVGILSSAFGVGGGMILVPILTGYYHFPFLTAVSTSLAVTFLNSIYNTAAYQRQKLIDWNVTARISVFAAVGAWAAAMASAYLDELVLRRTFIFTVILISLSPLFSHPKVTEKMASPSGSRALSSVIGLIIGGLSGLTGIGGGGFLSILLLSLRIVPEKKAAPTSISIILFLSAAGVIGHWTSLDLKSLALIFGASFLGSWVGIPLNSKMSTRTRQVFMLFLLLALLTRLAFR